MTNETKPDGGSAFPIPAVYHPAHGVLPASAFYDVGGMTPRQWYAGEAMKGLLAYPVPNENPYDWDPDQLADQAFRFADAMIKRGEQ